jgi:hypothetical protein
LLTQFIAVEQFVSVDKFGLLNYFGAKGSTQPPFLRLSGSAPLA